MTTDLPEIGRAVRVVEIMPRRDHRGVNTRTATGICRRHVQGRFVLVGHTLLCADQWTYVGEDGD